MKPHMLVLMAGVASLVGCAVGPDFKPPAPPTVNQYTATPLTSSTFVTAPVPGAWWTELGSARLTQTIELALQASPTLASAQASLRRAELNFAALSGSTRLPQLRASAGGQRQGINGAGMGLPDGERTFSSQSASVAASFDLDLAGGNRRELEALAAQIDYQAFQFEAARLNLAASIALSAISQAQLVAQIEATEDILRAQQAQLDITVRRLEAGVAADGDVQALRTQLERTRAGVPPLRNRLEQTRHLLAVLAGRAPGEVHDEALFTLPSFSMPAQLPLTVPSELVRRRPDIRASEALLHTASAQVGVAVARLYPSLTLSANIGSQALTSAGLFGAGSLVWGLAGQLAQPIFNPGLKAGVGAAEASLEAADANYRQTVLQALRNVADVLRTVETNALAQHSLGVAADASRQSLQYVERQYAHGVASYLQLLVAQQQDQQLRIELAASQAQRLADAVALYQAMGGGGG